MSHSSPPTIRPIPSADCRRVLVSDFDGTLWNHDFYLLFTERFGSPVGLVAWDEYRAGQITHFEAMRRIYASAAPGEAALEQLLQNAPLDPSVREGIERLIRHGWGLVVVSAGCLWYIDRLLTAAGLELEVHSNPGTIHDGRLLLERPVASRFQQEETGIDKSAVVQSLLAECDVVAFAGDGFPDLAPALLVPGKYRFARQNLASELDKRGSNYTRFENWIEITDRLCSDSD